MLFKRLCINSRTIANSAIYSLYKRAVQCQITSTHSSFRFRYKIAWVFEIEWNWCGFYRSSSTSRRLDFPFHCVRWCWLKMMWEAHWLNYDTPTNIVTKSYFYANTQWNYQSFGKCCVNFASSMLFISHEWKKEIMEKSKTKQSTIVLQEK